MFLFVGCVSSGLEVVEEGLEALLEVVVGGFEVACVPGVGYVAMGGMGDVVEKEGDFALGVGGDDAAELTEVGLFH